jgi:hypothetical protein
LATTNGGTGLTSFTSGGIVYASSTSALTTGSGLQFDGARLFVNTVSSNIQLQTTVNTNQAYISLADADNRTAVFRGPNSGSPNCAQIGTATNHDTAFIYGNTEQMRLTSTGLVIGANSPISKLDVRSGYITSGTGLSTSGTKVLGAYYSNGNIATWGTEYSNGSPVMGYGVWPSTAAAASFVSSTGIAVTRGAYTILGNTHIWYAGGVQTVAIDSAVTTAEIGRFGTSGEFLVGGNYSPYVASNRGYININGSSTALLGLSVAGVAAGYLYSSGVNLYVGAPTGYNILFDINGEKMRLAGSTGNLLIGTDTSLSSTYRLQVSDGINSSMSMSLISVQNTALVSRGTPDDLGWYHTKVYTGRDAATFSYGSYLAFYTEGKNSGTTDTSTEKGRFDPNGNFLIATTTARNKLTVQGTVYSTPTLGTASGNAFFGEAAGYGTMFGTSGFGYGWIQQQRVDGTATAYDLLLQPVGGNVIVGGTANPWGAKFVVYATGQGMELQTTSSTDPGIEISVNSNGTGQNAITVYSQTAATTTMAVRSNGNIVNTNNSYGAISDVKLKENIVDASPKLADMMQVKVRNYNLIGGTVKQLGVVAQELETVFPAMVDESPDRDKEGNDLGTTTKSVKYSVFVPMLIKAMQEQQALIESLTTRLAALEAK